VFRARILRARRGTNELAGIREDARYLAPAPGVVAFRPDSQNLGFHSGGSQRAFGCAAAARPDRKSGQGDDRRRRQEAGGAGFRRRRRFTDEDGVLFLNDGDELVLFLQSMSVVPQGAV